MRLIHGKDKTIKACIFLVILALIAFGDYSRYVYAIKIGAIITLLLSERYIKSTFYLKWATSFIAISVLSLLWSVDKSNSIFYIAWILQAMALAVAISNATHDLSDIEYILKCFFIAGLVLSLRVVIRSPIREWGSFRIGANMGYNSNELALKEAIGCLAGFYFWTNTKNTKRKIILLAGVIALIAIVLFTGSRKGSIMILMGVVIFLTLKSESSLKIIRNIIISLLLLAGFFLLITNVDVLYNVLGRRLLLTLNMFDADAYVGNSIGNRLSLIDIGIDLFKKNPIVGYGIGSFPTASGTNNYAHNNYIELIVDLGVVGLSVYYSMYIYNIGKTIRNLNSNRTLLSILLSFSLMFVVLEYGLVTFQSDYAQIIIALCCASLQVIRISPNNRDLEG